MSNDEKRVWGIHTTDDSLFLHNNIIAIGWKEFGDCSSIEPTREAFKDHYCKAYPNAKKGAIATSAGMLYRFTYEMKVGDYVVFPSKVDRKINIGVVESEFFYNPQAALYVQQRKVKWLKHLPRTVFSQGALYEVGSALSFFLLKNYADEYLQALDKSFKSTATLEEPDETIAATANDIVETTRDFVLKELSKNLKGYAFMALHQTMMLGMNTILPLGTLEEYMDVPRKVTDLPSLVKLDAGFVEQLENITAQLADLRSNELCLSEIESYCEPLRDVSCMIGRKLIDSTNNDADDKRRCWTDVLQMKRRVAIVNDAGVGKTYALHQLCHAAKAQGYSAVCLSLNKYPGIPLFEKLLTKYLGDSKKVVLVLDGYDEVKPEYVSGFISVLNDIGKRFADMTIIISSRSNFFACHPLQYELFRLAEITEQERIAYVEERDINSVSFFNQVRERRLEDICRNAFYFVELVRLWQIHNSLPDEADIMETIVESRIRSDWEKYKLSIPELSERTALLRRLFERIAFIMQCTHRQQLTATEMLQICTHDECEQLRLHGLWEDDASGNWAFAHNNFREYFAACWLRRQPWEQIVSYISWSPEKQRVKPSWMNVLAYMSKMKNSRDLQDWIAHNDPAIITLFERERFSEEERFSIFKRIYDQHEEELTWADVDYDARERMGAFASSGAAVEYILDKLTKKLHPRQEKNLLRVLAFFESLHGREDDCKLVISSIAFDDDYPDHTRKDALNVMRRFPQVFMEFTAKAAERSISSDSMDYRYHLQCFIEATGRLDDYFEIIIHELQQHERDEEAHSISRTLFLEHLCSTVKSEKSVLRLFEFASEHPECINESPFKEAWSNLFDVAAHCQDSYREKFLFAVLNLFSVEQRRRNTHGRCACTAAAQ